MTAVRYMRKPRRTGSLCERMVTTASNPMPSGVIEIFLLVHVHRSSVRDQRWMLRLSSAWTEHDLILSALLMAVRKIIARTDRDNTKYGTLVFRDFA